MKANDQAWTVFLDPDYSVLGLPSSPGRNGVRYLDVVTGWQGPPAVETGPRRDRSKRR